LLSFTPFKVSNHFLLAILCLYLLNNVYFFSSFSFVIFILWYIHSIVLKCHLGYLKFINDFLLLKYISA
jgi:hypothetical protein